MVKDYGGIEFDNPFIGCDNYIVEYYCSEMLLKAICLYIVKNRPQEEHTGKSIYKILDSNKGIYSPYQPYTRVGQPFSRSGYNQGHGGSGMDEVFNHLHKNKPFVIEVEYYKVFTLFTPQQQETVVATLLAANFSKYKK
jgi:hypothetical protein